MNKGWTLLWFMIIWLVIYVITYAEMIMMHETIHQTIYEKYGIDSYIVYLPEGVPLIKPGAVAYTMPYNSSLFVDNCDSYCILAHNQNEIVGYTANVILDAIFVAIALIGAVIILSRREESWRYI